VCLYAYLYVFLYVCLYVCFYVCIWLHVCVLYVCIYLCICASECVLVCVRKAEHMSPCVCLWPCQRCVCLSASGCARRVSVEAPPIYKGSVRKDVRTDTFAYWLIICIVVVVVVVVAVVVYRKIYTAGETILCRYFV